MKIIIFGNEGFVGTETQKLLEKNGHTIIGYDLLSGRDIRDYQQVRQVCLEEKPNRAILLAAIARFADADKDPKLAFETNVIGTRNVVEVCKELHIPLVYSSSGSALMDLQGYEAPYKEDIPARGNSVYGTSKALGEYYVREHTPHIILRYSHLYGKGKLGAGHGLVSGFYDRIKRGLEPILYNGVQTNDFLDEDSIALANMLAVTAKWSEWNEVYHIGSGHELSAKEAGEAICKVFGWEGKIDVKPRRGVDPDIFCFDITKAQTRLGFKPLYTFEEGLIRMKEKLDKDSNDSPQL
jgi:UDP-glucose 4-epimerase